MRREEEERGREERNRMGRREKLTEEAGAKPRRSKGSPRHTIASERHIHREFVLRAWCLRLHITRKKDS